MAMLGESIESEYWRGLLWRLRHQATTLRTNSVPLSTLIPLLNESADKLEELEKQVRDLTTAREEIIMGHTPPAQEN